MTAPTENRTQAKGFKVPCANLYTIGASDYFYCQFTHFYTLDFRQVPKGNIVCPQNQNMYNKFLVND